MKDNIYKELMSYKNYNPTSTPVFQNKKVFWSHPLELFTLQNIFKAFSMWLLKEKGRIKLNNTTSK